MGVTISIKAPSTMNPVLGPSGCLLVHMTTPLASASVFSSSFFTFLKRNSSMHQEGCTCSTPIHILFLIILFLTSKIHYELHKFNKKKSPNDNGTFSHQVPKPIKLTKFNKKNICLQQNHQTFIIFFLIFIMIIKTIIFLH